MIFDATDEMILTLQGNGGGIALIKTIITLEVILGQE